MRKLITNLGQICITCPIFFSCVVSVVGFVVVVFGGGGGGVVVVVVVVVVVAENSGEVRPEAFSIKVLYLVFSMLSIFYRNSD